MPVRQYVISDPPTINFCLYITNGIPSVVWQQQIGKAYIKNYKVVQNDRPDRYYDLDYTKDFETQFRPLQLIEEYNPQYIDTSTERIRIGLMNYTINKRCNFDMTIIPQRTMRKTLKFLIPICPGPS